MQKITPCLWFDHQAEEAANLYTTIFANGQIHDRTHYSEVGREIHGMAAGTVLTVDFEIDGVKMVAMNGGPHFQLNPAISFIISRESKEEIDALWRQLAEGGEVRMPLQDYPFSPYYGWIEDRFGLSWQLILPNPEGEMRPSLVPSMLFVGAVAGQTRNAIEFYTGIFPDSAPGRLVPYGPGHEPDQAESLMYSDFKLAGQWFAAMDSAADHKFKFNEAVSLIVTCEDQAEIDRYWEKLSAVPESEQCGWLKDKYGVSWQIVPKGMTEMLNDPDQERAKRAMANLLSMKKIEIDKLV